ncbi:MAG TPA: YbaN family protein [Fimbriimonadaceae bacterium]|nr:YbaN family protein [Fimbriimonadaceae bacterium]
MIVETTPTKPRVRSVRPGARRLWTALGVLFVGLGIVGYILPVMPGTVFLIVALFCFKRGSERLENLLLNHPRVGPILQDWERERSISKRTKIVAISMMWLFIVGSVASIRIPWIIASAVVLGVVGTAYIASRKTKYD